MGKLFSKKIAALVLLIILQIFFSSTLIPQGTPIRLMINGEIVTPDVPPVIKDSRTLVPIRVITEKMGAEIEWEPVKREVHIALDGSKIILAIGNKIAIVNGKNVPMDVPAEIINDRTFVPLRFIGEATGAEVDWDNVNRVAIVNQRKTAGTKVVDVKMETIGNQRVLVIKSDGRLDYTSFTLPDPHRIIIDFNNAVMAVKNTVVNINEQDIRRVRISQFEVNPNKARVVLDMDRQSPYNIARLDDKTIGVFIGLEPVIPPPSANDPPVTPPPVTQPPVAPPPVDSKDTNVVTGIEVERKENVLSTIYLSQKMNFNVTELKNPTRIVVDINGASLGANLPSTGSIPVNSEDISRVRFSQFTVNPNSVRVVYDVIKDFPYIVSQDQNGNINLLTGNILNGITFNQTPVGTEVILSALSKIDHTVTVADNKMKIILANTDINLHKTSIPVHTSTLNNIEITRIGSSTVLTFELPYYWNHSITNSENNLKINLEKSPLDGKLIVVDPGHGGRSPGVVVRGVAEKDLVLDISLRLEPLLKNMGATVFMIRTTDIDIDYRLRAELANALKADLFLSVHINGFTNTAVNGIETLYTDKDNGISRRLAQIIQRNLIADLGLTNRGIVDRPNIVVVRETQMPAVLAEIGFLTNPGDFEKVTNPEFRQQAAQALAKGILEFFE